MATRLPLLPGNTFVDPRKQNFAKKQLFDLKQGVPITDKPASSPKSSAAEYLRSPELQGALERPVLQFSGFFKESVHESALENYRVRKCVINYYLEDDTIHVTEPKVENSGIPQGVFIKRQTVPKDDWSKFTFRDFNVGIDITLFGRTFHIYSCNEGTRKFLTSAGVSVNANESAPRDSYDDLLEKKRGIQSPARNVGARMDPLRQYLENDRKVLRFYCIWDDTPELFGDERAFVLHYFLADDTVEIREILDSNSGRDPFPMFLRRQKLPRAFQPSIGGERDYYTYEDLYVGAMINVFGREIQLVDADYFTRKFYEENFGITFQTSDRYKNTLDSSKDEPLRPIEIPPHNGFGSEEDSLGSVLHLVPKAPKRDFSKQIENDGHVLRFEASMITEDALNKERRFIVNFYMSDDTLSIFEPPQRNSGISGGLFLIRGKYKQQGQNSFICSDDLRVGGTISLFGNTFNLNRADEHTLKFFEKNSTPRDAATESLDQTIAEKFRSTRGKLMDEFRYVDSNRDHKVSKAEFDLILNHFKIQLSQQEKDHVFKRFDKVGSGLLSYHDFVRVIERA